MYVKIFISLFLSLFFVWNSNAQISQKGNITSVLFVKPPQDGAAFAEIAGTYNKSPQGAAALFVMAMLSFSQKPINGLQSFAQCVWPDMLVVGELGYNNKQLKEADIQKLRTQIGAMTYLPKSYIKGATADNLYLLPKQNYVVEVQTTVMSGDPASGLMKVFVRCSGAAVPRPITLKKDANGLWYVYEWSAMLTEVTAPRNSKEMSRDSDN